MFGSIADGATSLLKSILRGILPDPSGESDGVFGFIKKAVSSVIPDGVYEFAGLDPKTGEAIPEPESEQLEAATGGGSNRFDRVQSRMDRKRERLSATQDENFDLASPPPPPPVIINQTDASQVSTNTSSSSSACTYKRYFSACWNSARSSYVWLWLMVIDVRPILSIDGFAVCSDSILGV